MKAKLMDLYLEDERKLKNKINELAKENALLQRAIKRKNYTIGELITELRKHHVMQLQERLN